MTVHVLLKDTPRIIIKDVSGTKVVEPFYCVLGGGDKVFRYPIHGIKEIIEVPDEKDN